MKWKKAALCIAGLTVAGLLLVSFRMWYSPPTSKLPEDTPVRVLFVGNSLTFYNELPEMVAELARSGGHEIMVDVSAPGGWRLSDHAASPVTCDKIDQQTWDFVVLQEQSVIPSIADERDQQMYPAVRLLYKKIDEQGATLILFITWAHQHGFLDAGYTTFDDMQLHLTAGYMEIARELGVMVAPVGSAWQHCITHYPQLDLFHQDGVHPSREGSYLSACVFYAVIFQQSPAGLPYTAGLPDEVAQTLQTIAAETVLPDTG
jgi:hypothetical protein